MEVGYNYTWPFNRYGTTIGPRDLENDPPAGAADATPVFRDPSRQPPGGSLARNLKVLKDDLGIAKVRMFLLGNAYNYGARPVIEASGRAAFTAPPALHPLFCDHFRQMLEVFRDEGMQILPSLIDFGAFYPLVLGTAGGGRTSLLTTQRSAFLDTVLAPLLDVAREPSLEGVVFAWEVANEPVWNTITAPFIGRPHTTSSAADVGRDVMASFLGECLAAIEARGFRSTVGHRFLADLRGPLPAGTLPQFHYYGATALVRRLVGVGDPAPIPRAEDLARDPRTRGAFVGEIGAAPGGARNAFGDVEPGALWPECHGRDASRAGAAFERLSVLASKGYDLAFVWPDLSDKEPGVVNDDDLKLSADARASIRRFTMGSAGPDVA